MKDVKTQSLFVEKNRPVINVSKEIQYLTKYANEEKIPILYHEDFAKLTNEIGVDKFRKDLSQYIYEVRPPYPTQDITMEDVAKTFFSLKDTYTYQYTKPQEDIIKNVNEKHDDYKYPYKTHGLGIIDTSGTHNAVSNYYHQLLRLNCPSARGKAVANTWSEGTANDIWRCLKACWGGINNMKEVEINGVKQRMGGALTKDAYRSTFRLGSFIATQFKPLVAKTIYTMTKAEKVLDTSCGWGDRLAGFYTSNAKEYIGSDPNPFTFLKYIQQTKDYEKFLGNNNPDLHIEENFFHCNGVKKVTIYRSGAENLPWQDIKNIDCSFTSPPYFSTEKYNEGGDKEEDQSWKKFVTFDDWLYKFFMPVSINCFNSLSDKGHLLINIIDPTIKSKRYRCCDVIVDELLDSYKGIVGMTMAQRPLKRTAIQRKNNEKGLNENLALMDDDNKLLAHYIENIWCFGKNNIDYFEDYKTERDRQGSLF
jgi:hypothetical protein